MAPCWTARHAPLDALVRRALVADRSAIYDVIDVRGKAGASALLVAGMSDSHAGTRRHSALIAGTTMDFLDEPSLVLPIAHLLADDEVTVRRMAAGVLGYFYDQRAVPFLERVLADTDPDVRANAQKSLERLMRHC
ncbi:MAG: HEAT repeat domain-containing protein [Planctomycetes bacterium]|nr:HEAT repeat domain-containing protein [Planctomycetota bacterium]